MTVSVVIPAYNATAFLERTVPAVLDLQGALEWIWVDDGSTDATGVELRRLTQGHPSVRILELGRNEGRAAARNAGIELAKGDWIACLDVDARPRPGYLLAHQEVFARPEAVVSMGSIHPADPVPGDPYSQYLSAYPRGVPSRQLVASWKHFVTCAACIRADALRSVGCFDESI
ncbi:MAG: glycosyltransferase family 2 protein [Bacteroidota bacterium]